MGSDPLRDTYEDYTRVFMFLVAYISPLPRFEMFLFFQREFPFLFEVSFFSEKYRGIKFFFSFYETRRCEGKNCKNLSCIVCISKKNVCVCTDIFQHEKNE